MELEIELDNKEKEGYLNEFKEKMEKMYDKLPFDITKLDVLCRNMDSNSFEGNVILKHKTNLTTFLNVFKDGIVSFKSSCCNDDLEVKYLPSSELHLFFCKMCHDLDFILLRKIGMGIRK